MKTFTMLTLGFLLGALTIAACTKTPPPVATPVVVASPVDAKTVQAAAVASQAQAAQPAPAQAAPVVVVASKAPAHAPVSMAAHAATKSCMAHAEKAAYAKAWGNAITANRMLGKKEFTEVFELPKGWC